MRKILSMGLATIIGTATVAGINGLPKLENQPEDEVACQKQDNIARKTIPRIGRIEKSQTEVDNPYAKVDFSVLQYLIGFGSENGVYHFIEEINNGRDISNYFKDTSKHEGLARAVIIRRLTRESSTSIYESMFPGVKLTSWWNDRTELGKVEEILRLAKSNPEAVYKKQPLSR